MLPKKIIACLDVKDGQVIKGTQFKQHETMGDILPLAKRYAKEGADELVLYDIVASVRGQTVDKSWVSRIANAVDIPFCVAGGIRSIEEARLLFEQGADKISINTPALQTPDLINHLVKAFGQERIVVGVDSFFNAQTQAYEVHQLTGDEATSAKTQWQTLAWVQEIQKRGAGEIVINVMNQDGVREGYDIEQMKAIRAICQVNLVASGGAGTMQHFAEVFQQANVDGALAASAFHKQLVKIPELKSYLRTQNIKVA